MDEQLSTQPSKELTDVFELGARVGEHNTFGLVAGRCTAAQAHALRRLREEKAYRQFTPHWRDFCSRHLNMSGAQADRIIALLDEFGPGYFELSQLTRISADTYRAVEPVIKDHALHFQGEVIQLDPENSRKVAAAIAELRRQAAPPEKAAKPTDTAQLLADIDRRFSSILRDLQRVLRNSEGHHSQFHALLQRINSTFLKLRAENHV